MYLKKNINAYEEVKHYLELEGTISRKEASSVYRVSLLQTMLYVFDRNTLSNLIYTTEVLQSSTC